MSTHVISIKKLGFCLTKDLFFWKSPKYGQKNCHKFGEDFFFWRSPKFGQLVVNEFRKKGFLLFGDENMVTLL